MDFRTKLIDAVRSVPGLYDKKSSMYYNQQLRQRTWCEISTNLKRSAKECQSVWRYLRDQFVRELGKMRQSGGHIKCGKGTWKYFERMSFLMEYIQPAPSRSQSPENAGSDDNTIQSQATSKHKPSTIHSSMFNDDDFNEKSTLPPELTATVKKETDYTDTLNYVTALLNTQAAQASQLNNDNDRLNFNDRLVSIIQSLINLVAQQVREQEYNKSRNTDFLRALDTYLLQLPENVQDSLKVDMLNLVYKKQFM